MMRSIRLSTLVLGALVLLAPRLASAESAYGFDLGPPGCVCDDDCQPYGMSYCNRPASGSPGACSNAQPGTPCPDGGVKDLGPDLTLDVGGPEAGPPDDPMIAMEAGGDPQPDAGVVAPKDDGGGCRVGSGVHGWTLLLLLGFLAFRRRR